MNPNRNSRESARRFNVAHAAMLVGGTLLLAAGVSHTREARETDKIKSDTITVIAGPGDTITRLVEREAIDSGADQDNISKYVDVAVDINGGSTILRDQAVEIPNIPDVNQAAAEK